MMNLVSKFFAGLGLALAINATTYAAVLVTADNGTLLGANGVDVNGSLYDVTFGDGVILNGITAFSTELSASAAAYSLVTQVF